jgi:hypothetical protein
VSYVDSVYYKETYRGNTIPDAELDSYLQKASDQIDIATYFRIQQLGSLTEFQQKQIKTAVCSQADSLYEYQGIPDGVKSYSLDGMSVTLGDSTESISSKAVAYLRSTGLLYRGL